MDDLDINMMELELEEEESRAEDQVPRRVKRGREEGEAQVAPPRTVGPLAVGPLAVIPQVVGCGLSQEARSLISADHRQETWPRAVLEGVMRSLTPWHRDFVTAKQALQATDKTGSMVVPYVYARGMSFGRKYARGVSYQSASKALRALCCIDVDEDHDINNCFPDLLDQIFQRHSIECGELNAYVVHREEMIEDIVVHNPQFNRNDVKKMFIVALHYGDYKNYNGNVRILGLDMLQAKLRLAAGKLIPLYPEEAEMAKRQKNHRFRNSNGLFGKRLNERGRAISFICQRYEEIVMWHKSFFTYTKGWQLSTRIHDGEHVKPRPGLTFPHDECSAFVFERTGFRIRFETKSFKPQEALPDNVNSGTPTYLFELEGVLLTLETNSQGQKRRSVVWDSEQVHQLKGLAGPGLRVGIFTKLSRRVLDSLGIVETLQEKLGIALAPVLTEEHMLQASDEYQTEVELNHGKELTHVKPLGLYFGQTPVTLFDCEPLNVIPSERMNVRVCTAFDKTADIFNASHTIPQGVTPVISTSPVVAPVGSWNPVSLRDIAKTHEKDPEEAKLQICRAMNVRMAFIRMGKPKILEQRGQSWHARTVDDARLSLKPYSVLIMNMAKKERPMEHVNPFDIWFGHPECRKYNDAQFVPPGGPPGSDVVPDDTLNLFTRFVVTREDALEKAAEETRENGDGMSVPEYVQTLIEPMMKHVNAIFGGQAEQIEFFLDWMASILQRPGLRSEMAPVIKGPQGIGKGLLLYHIAKIIGIYYYETQRIDSVLGSFNPECLRNNLITFLDECTFDGNKAQADELKGLITSATRELRTKFMNAETLRNTSHYFAGTNRDNAVYVDAQDRRYWITVIEWLLEFSGKATTETEAHFARIREVPVWAWAYFLYTRELRGFSARCYPSTEGIRHMKRKNFEPHEAFVEHCLSEGALPNAQDVLGVPSMSWDKLGAAVTPGALYQMYHAYFEAHRSTFRSHGLLGKNIFMDKWRKMIPGTKYVQGGSWVGRARKFELPGLEIARREFQAFIKETTWDWNEPATAT